MGVGANTLALSGSTASKTGLPASVTPKPSPPLARDIGFTGRFQIAVPAKRTGVWT